MAKLENPWPSGLSRRNWPIWLAGLVLVLIALAPFDEATSRWAQSIPAPIRGFFAAITDFGLSDWILYPTLVCALVFSLLAQLWRSIAVKRALAELAWLSTYVFIGVGFPGLFTAIVKRLIGRGRPELLDTVGPWGFQSVFNDHSFQSFPSGHSTTAFAIAITLSFVDRRLFAPLIVMAGLVVLSRVVVGAHFPTDVVAGAVVGTLLAYGVRSFFADRGWLFRRRTDGTIRRRKLAALRRLVQRRRAR